MAAVGEVLGTGVIGSLICIPLAYFLGLQDFFIKPLMITFIVSSAIGSIISYFLLLTLKTWYSSKVYKIIFMIYDFKQSHCLF